MNDINPTIIAVLVAVLVILALFIFLLSRIRRAGPNEALVIVGRGAEPKVVSGGRAFVIPVLEEAFTVSLEQSSISLDVRGPDAKFIDTSVRATVLFKVGGTEEAIRRAAQRFLNQQDDLKTPLNQALEGAIRPIIASMSVDDLIAKRDAFQDQVVSSIKADLAEQGFQVDMVNLSDIDTPGSDYLKNKARREAARARQDAEVAEAETRLATENARLDSDEKIAERERDLALKRSAIKAQTDKAEAEAQAAGQLARAEQDKLVAVQQRDALAEQALVTEEQLDIDVRKPAEAAAYAQVQEANANRDTSNAAAEAEAFRRQKVAEANKTAAVLDAEATEATGRAEAAALEAKGLAKAATIKAEAEALAVQSEAVLAQQAIQILPQVVAAAAAAYEKVGEITIVSHDGASAPVKGIADFITQGKAIVDSVLPELGALLTPSPSAPATVTEVKTGNHPV